jgi:hypothetical protein
VLRDYSTYAAVENSIRERSAMKANGLWDFILRKECLWAFALLLAGVSAYILMRFAPNVPYLDDYAVLGLFQALDGAESLGKKAAILAASFNEHRIITTRLILLSTQYLPGGVDFRLLCFIGSASLLGAILIIVQSLGEKRLLSLVIFLAVVIQAQLFKVVFYPMAAVTHWVALLLASGYLFVILTRKSIALSLLLWVAAAITSGPGIFLGLISIPILLLQKRRKDLLISATMLAMIMLLYFHGPGSPRVSTKSLAFFLENAGSASLFFFSILGGIAQLPNWSGRHVNLTGTSMYFPVLAGLAIFVYFAVLAYRFIKYPDTRERNLSYLAFAAWFMLQAAMVVYGRLDIYGSDTVNWALDARYRIYGQLLAALVIVHLLSSLKSGISGPVTAITVVALVAFNLAWQAGGYLRANRELPKRELAMAKHLQCGRLLKSRGPKSQKSDTKLVAYLVDKNIYQPELPAVTCVSKRPRRK